MQQSLSRTLHGGHAAVTRWVAQQGPGAGHPKASKVAEAGPGPPRGDRHLARSEHRCGAFTHGPGPMGLLGVVALFGVALMTASFVPSEYNM